MRPQTMGTSRPPVALGVYESVSSSNGASLPESSLLNAHGPLLHRALSSQCSQISSPFSSSEITSGIVLRNLLEVHDMIEIPADDQLTPSNRC